MTRKDPDGYGDLCHNVTAAPPCPASTVHSMTMSGSLCALAGRTAIVRTATGQMALGTVTR